MPSPGLPAPFKELPSTAAVLAPHEGLLIPSSQATPPLPTPHVPLPRAKPRSVLVVDMDRLTTQVTHLSLQGGQLGALVDYCTSRVEAVEDQLRASLQVLLGFDALRAVARYQEVPVEKALRKVLAMGPIERIKAYPSRPPSGNRGLSGRVRQEQTAITFDVSFPRLTLPLSSHPIVAHFYPLRDG